MNQKNQEARRKIAQTNRRTIPITSPLIRMIKRRLHKQNKNFLVLILGPTGTGKSMIGLRMCELLDKNFLMGKVCMNTLDFITNVTNGAKKGAALLYEELGVSADAGEWWSLQNKVLKYIAQTFRTDNLAVFFTVPDEDFIDNRIALLFHAVIETHHIDYDTGIAYFRMYRVQKNHKTGKVYRKYYCFWEKDDKGIIRPYKYSMLGLHLPSEWLLGDYTTGRDAFNVQLKEDMMQSLTTGKYRKLGVKMYKQKEGIVKKADADKYDKMARAIADNPKEFLDAKGRILDIRVREKFDIGIVNAAQVIRSARAYMAKLDMNNKKHIH